MTVSQECSPMLARSSFQKRLLIVTVRKKLMLYQEIKLKYLQLTSLSLKTAVSVKIQNLLVIQVNSNMICFPCYCLLVYL